MTTLIEVPLPAELVAFMDEQIASGNAANRDEYVLGVIKREQRRQRPSRRSNGSTFTVERFARYFLHDLAHHARDVSSG